MSNGGRDKNRSHWLRDAIVAVVVALIVALVAGGTAPWWLSAFDNDDGEDESVETDEGSGEATSNGGGGSEEGTTTSSPPVTSGDPGGCELTIANPFAEISEQPSHTALVIRQVPAGVYPTLDTALTSFAGRDERWFLIAVESREGWIQDDTILIESKSEGCP